MQFKQPQVRVDYPGLFPEGSCAIHPDIDENAQLDRVYKVYRESQEQISLFHKWTEKITTNDKELLNVLAEYKSLFHSNARFCDLHGHSFQNFALCATNHMEHNQVRSLSISPDHSDKRLLRSRVFAISSRDDIDWDGHSIQDEEKRREKRQELVKHLQSLTLHDWYNPKELSNSDHSETLQKHDFQVRVLREGTQQVVENLYQELNEDDDKLIAWVNFANAHNVCG
jgi:hypothetical protein